MLNVVLMKPSKHIFFVKTHENKKKKKIKEIIATGPGKLAGRWNRRVSLEIRKPSPNQPQGKLRVNTIIPQTEQGSPNWVPNNSLNQEYSSEAHVLIIWRW